MLAHESHMGRERNHPNKPRRAMRAYGDRMAFWPCGPHAGAWSLHGETGEGEGKEGLGSSFFSLLREASPSVH